MLIQSIAELTFLILFIFGSFWFSDQIQETIGLETASFYGMRGMLLGKNATEEIEHYFKAYETDRKPFIPSNHLTHIKTSHHKHRLGLEVGFHDRRLLRMEKNMPMNDIFKKQSTPYYSELWKAHQEETR